MWPDAVRLVIAYLAPIVAPARAVSRVPQDAAPREPLVQVRRIGGQALLPVRDVARLDTYAWAPDDERAWELGLQVRAAIWSLAGTDLLGPVCYRVEEFLGPRQQDDPSSLTPRIWATYELHIRADAAIQPAPGP
jgi:hypothetical protein